MSGFLNRMIGAAAALVVIAVAARAQGTVCNSPCKLIHLPLIIEKNQQPRPNSNPLAELQGKVQAQVYFEYQVDKPVMQVRGSVSPRYPDSLKTAKVEGEVVVAFVVDTLGLADPKSLKILKSTHRLFSNAVRDALPQMSFIPAELKGRKVRQLVQQPFVFHIAH